jgi:hypothetical protein
MTVGPRVPSRRRAGLTMVNPGAALAPSMMRSVPEGPAIRHPMPRAQCLHQPRRIATVMLLVWLFASFASWANACLVQPSAAAADAREHRQGSGASEHPGGDPHAAAQTQGTDPPDPARQACASFCETGQSIVAKAQPFKGDMGSDATMPPPAALVGWPAFTAGQTAPRWRPLAAPPPPGPPVAIAYLRLTR